MDPTAPKERERWDRAEKAVCLVDVVDWIGCGAIWFDDIDNEGPFGSVVEGISMRVDEGGSTVVDDDGGKELSLLFKPEAMIELCDDGWKSKLRMNLMI